MQVLFRYCANKICEHATVDSEKPQEKQPATVVPEHSRRRKNIVEKD